MAIKSGSVDSVLIPEGLSSAHAVVLFLHGPPWGMWVFPFSPVLGSSHLLRKIGVIESIGAGSNQEALVVHNASADLLAAVTTAGTIPVEGPTGVLCWLDALRYLCAKPSAEMTTFICAQCIVAPLWTLVPPCCREELITCRSDLALTRRILTDAAVLLMQLSLSQRTDIQEAGYDSGPIVLNTGLAAPPLATNIFRDAQLPPHLLDATLRIFDAAATVGDPSPSSPSMLSNIRQTLICLRLMTRTEKGCVEVLTTALPWLQRTTTSVRLPPFIIQQLASEALRNLYAEECNRPMAEDGPFLPIECIKIIRDLWINCPSPDESLYFMLPCDKEALKSCRIFRAIERMCVLLPPTPLTSEMQVHQELLRRAPWLQVLDDPDLPECYVTGSLLTEAIVRSGGNWDDKGLVGDVDIFCQELESLDKLADRVAKAMPSPVVEMTRASAKRWKVSAEGEYKQVIIDNWNIRGDIYVNRLGTVRQYYLPHLRVAFAWKARRLFLHPSAAIGLATGVNIDFTSVNGTRNTFELLERKWRAGFSTLLNTREHGQFTQYLFSTTRNADERILLEVAFASMHKSCWGQLLFKEDRLSRFVHNLDGLAPTVVVAS